MDLLALSLRSSQRNDSFWGFRDGLGPLAEQQVSSSKKVGNSCLARGKKKGAEHLL